MSKIKGLKAREVLDSRGNPTVECDIITDKGLFRAMVPSGASAGQHEAVELRDGIATRYLGKGVHKAVANANSFISEEIVGLDCTDQKEIDETMIELDGTENKGKFGANAILAVSMACCKAGAAEKGIPLYRYIGELFGSNPDTIPVPMCNVINGGKHAGQENDIQEHMIMPVGAANFTEGIRMVSETYHCLKSLLKKKFGAGAMLIGDEGGFAPPQLKTVQERLGLVTEAIKKAGYENEMVFTLDSASSEFFRDGVYTVGTKKMSGGEMIDFYADLIKTYPIVSIEDGLAEDDWDSWVEMTKKLGDKIQIVGDDLFVTNTKRVKKGIELKAANSVLIKLNQIGTVTETLGAIKMAYDTKWTAVVSHRSGETEDSFIADLVVGVNAGQIKTGAPARSDRNAKYNQLIRIEEELGSKAKYLGRKFR
ncbi:MAG: phosphopyruvate hydratase [Nanoarchaeota archaeon]|nr:phosphopyruvate hydratase [Nanoarchaeota archaeon]MBU1004526.1 phosphopyruvate hydratase [Nanoarchaeota archaeon]MBU1945937.1 phosphopyruvate hydratase [Nanoarchaeota archaeon]